MTLVDGHRDELRASGLTDETIARAGIYSAPERQVRDVLGYGAGAGMVFPYPALNGGAPYARVKLDNAGDDGKRYRSPAKQPNRLYVPAVLDAKVLADTSTPLYITEGEKKALKACQEGLACLAVSGVWSWRTRDRADHSIPIPDLDHIGWTGRAIYIAFDSDLATNPSVQRAEIALAQELRHRGAEVFAVRLPGGPNGEKVGLDDYLITHSVEALCALEPMAIFDPAAAGVDAPYIESLAEFLADEEPPLDVIFPELLPRGVIMLIHGEARARKSLAAFELALSAATGTAPFALDRFRPAQPITVLYIQEEDPRSLTRPRVRRLVRERCGTELPPGLHVSVRRGVDLDDPAWVERLIADLQRLGVKLLVLDAARRFSAKTDEGPAKVRELTAVLRSIVTTSGATIVIVHHDTKPPQSGQDQRRRSQRASGGDWFAACECPVSVERVNDLESLVFPQDYKFSADPAPFTFECISDGSLIARLVGSDVTTDHAERAGIRGKVVDWLRANGPASKTAMKKAGLGRWETIEGAIESLLREHKIDSGPGRKAGTHLYFVVGMNRPEIGDGSTAETVR
jgi:hypothetical protein